MGAHKAGTNYKDIAESTGLSKNTVSTSIRRASKRYEGHSIPREGRFKALSYRQR